MSIADYESRGHAMSERERLAGGGLNEVLRQDATVLRPLGPWSDTVHRLLAHLRAKGFMLSPSFHGVTEDGLEILDYLPGVIGGYPITSDASSTAALVSAAQVLRALHDATASFLLGPTDVWALPPQSPYEVICHNDFGPHNCVLGGGEVIGVIDFDLAGPGPRIWDIAYALYRWAPMSAVPAANANSAVAEQAVRVQQFCDAYGLDDGSRARVVDATIARLRGLLTFMGAEAERGNEAFARMLIQGHDIIYERDIAYIEMHRRAFSL